MDTASSSTLAPADTGTAGSGSDDAPVTVAHTTPASRQRSSVGGVLGIILVIGIVIVGAFYLWGERIAQNAPPTEAPPVTVE